MHGSLYDDIWSCARKFDTFLIERWVARPKGTDSGDFQTVWKKSLCHFEPCCLEFSTTIPSNISMILSGCSKAFNTSELSSRKLLVVSAFKRAMVRLNESARSNLLWRSIMVVLGLKARTPYVISSTSYRRYCSLSQHLMTFGMIQKRIFNADLTRMLPHNKFLLAG